MEGPLSGIRVLDLTNFWGIYGTKLLADLGADVIRVEPPEGDPLRRKPPMIKSEGESAYFAYMNTSKYSVTLDLESPSGRRELEQLAESVDAVVESRPRDGDLHALLDDAALRSRLPHLVYTVVTPFGESGPKSGWQATDVTIMAQGGLAWLAGEPDGPPLVAGGEQSGIIAGLYAAVGTLMAIDYAERTGQGQRVDVNVQEGVCMALENAIQFHQLEGRMRRRAGSFPREAGTGIFPCRDGYIYLMAGRLSTPKGWSAVIAWLNESGVAGADLLLDPKWNEYAYRATPEAARAFYSIFTRFSRHWNKAELYEEGQRRGIAISPVNTIADFVTDRQLSARKWITQVTREDGSVRRLPGPPMRFSRTPWRIRWEAPRPGEHNQTALVRVAAGKNTHGESGGAASNA